MVYVPEMPRVDVSGALHSGFEVGQAIGGSRDKRKAKNALQRIYAGDQSAIADLMAVDPEAGRAVETQVGVQQFVKPAGREVELAGPVRPGVDEPLTTRTPASVDTEGLTSYLASRGDSGALKALMEKAGPQAAAKWGYSKESAINPATGQEEYFITDDTGNVKWLGIKPKPQSPKVEQAPKPQLVTGVDPNTGLPTYQWVTPGEQPSISPPDKGVQASEGERNAAGFYERAAETGAKLNELEDAGGALPTVGTDIAGLFGDYAESKVMNDAQQQYKTLAMAWIRAKLRKESGAAISDKEAESEYKTYFPIPGDSPMRIEEKRNLRRLAENELKTSAGRALKQQSGPTISPVIPPIPPGIPPIPEKFAAGRNNPKYVEYWIARHQQTKADGTPMTAADRRRIDERARQNGVIK